MVLITKSSNNRKRRAYQRERAKYEQDRWAFEQAHRMPSQQPQPWGAPDRQQLH